MGKIELLVQLAKEVESEDPIDWGLLNISEEDAYRLMAMNVLEMTDDVLILKATLTKLLVENMTLNIKLLANEKTKNDMDSQ